MTVSSQTNNETFHGNGVTTVWDLPFRFFSNTDISVYLVDPVTQASTPLVLGSDYTLTGAGLPEQFGFAPGKITTVVPVANLKDLYVERVMEVEQLTDIVNQGKFFPEVHEDVFDRLTMQIQQAIAGVNNSIQLEKNGLFWGFRGYRGGNAADPINPQDVATASWVQAQDAGVRAYAESLVAGVVGGYGSFQQAGVGAAIRTFQSKMRDTVSVLDFTGVVGDGINNDSAGIQAAYDSLPASGGVLEFPAGKNYLFSGITGSKPVIFSGAGGFNGGATLTNNSATAPFLTLTNASNFILTGLNITSSPLRTGGAYFKFTNVNRVLFEKFFANKYYMFLDHDGGSEIYFEEFQLFDGVANSVVPGGGALRFGNTSYTGSISLDNGYIKCTDGALQPAFGILAKYVDGLTLGPGLFIIQHGVDIDVAPASGQTASLIKAMGSCIDTANIGLYMRPAAGGRVLRCAFVGCWFGAHSTSGVVIDGTLGIIDGVSFIGGEAISNVSTGFNIFGAGADNIDISLMDIGGNGIGIRITDNANVYVKNNGIGDAGLSGANTSGISLDSTVSGVITGNEFKSNGTAISGTPGTAMGVFENGGISNWKSTSVTPTAVSGTITTASGTLRTKKKYDTVEFEYTATVTTNGSGVDGLVLALPYVPVGAFSGSGRAFGISGKQLQIFANGGSSAFIYNYDGSYPAVSGEIITVSGRYITNP